MDDNEFELDLDAVQANTENKLKVKNRFEQLSEKVILTAKEKEEVEAKYKAETESRSKAEKERDFYKDFSQISSKYPNATAYQDQILEKVNNGYSTEDAALAVLAREGKLGGGVQSITEGTQTYDTSTVAGGSAATAMADFGDKSPEEMTQEERRSALLQAEKEGANLLKF